MRTLLICVSLILSGCSDPSSTAAQNTLREVAMDKVAAERRVRTQSLNGSTLMRYAEALRWLFELVLKTN